MPVHVLRVEERFVDLGHKVTRNPFVMRFVFLVVEHQIGYDLHLRVHCLTPFVSSANNRSWYSALAPFSWVAPFPKA